MRKTSLLSSWKCITQRSGVLEIQSMLALYVTLKMDVWWGTSVYIDDSRTTRSASWIGVKQ